MKDVPPLPCITREQARELDRVAGERYAIPTLLLMENAGAFAAQWIRQRHRGGSIAILCGKGNNGGDGFVIARHLYNYGLPVDIFFMGQVAEVKPSSDAGVNLEILRRMGLCPQQVLDAEALQSLRPRIEGAETLVDAIFGTGLQGNIREPMLSIMAQIASWHKNIIAIDIPSGLDANSGEVLGVALAASATITFCRAKQGFFRGQGPRYIGEVVVVDISIPRQLLVNL